MLTCTVLFLWIITIAHSVQTIQNNRQRLCGFSPRPGFFFPRIIGGEVVKHAKMWPWVASLQHDNRHQCGASLVSSKFALTAAHCVYGINPHRLSLTFGVKDISKAGNIFYVKNMTIHPKYDGNFFLNDIAVLELNQPVDLNRLDFTPICLPSIDSSIGDSIDYPVDGTKLIAIGWGTVDPLIRAPSMLLRQVTLQAIAIEHPSCQETINNATMQFCAGVHQGGKDTCFGDSGGPLMMFSDNSWQIVGITSFGANCGLPGFAGVYTRVLHYDSFIRNVIGEDIAQRSVKIGLQN